MMLILFFAFGLIVVFTVRWKRNKPVERRKEIMRLMVLASEEAARAELECSAKYNSECFVCYSPCTTRCSRCKAVRYCSGKCQIIHWRQGHRDECCLPNNHFNDLERNTDKKAVSKEYQDEICWNSMKREDSYNSKPIVTFADEAESSDSSVSWRDDCEVGPAFVTSNRVSTSSSFDSFDTNSVDELPLPHTPKRLEEHLFNYSAWDGSDTKANVNYTKLTKSPPPDYSLSDDSLDSSSGSSTNNSDGSKVFEPSFVPYSDSWEWEGTAESNRVGNDIHNHCTRTSFSKGGEDDLADKNSSLLFSFNISRNEVPGSESECFKPKSLSDDADPAVRQNKLSSCAGHLSEKMVWDVSRVKSSLTRSSEKASSVENKEASSTVGSLRPVPTGSSKIIKSLWKTENNGLKTAVQKVVREQFPFNTYQQDVSGSQSQRLKPQHHLSGNADPIIAQSKFCSSAVPLTEKLTTEVSMVKNSQTLSSEKPSSVDSQRARSTVDSLRSVPTGSSEFEESFFETSDYGLKTSTLDFFFPLNISQQDVPLQSHRSMPQNHLSDDDDTIIVQNKFSSSGVPPSEDVSTEKSSPTMSSEKPSSFDNKGARSTADSVCQVSTGSSKIIINSLLEIGKNGLKPSAQKVVQEFPCDMSQQSQRFNPQNHLSGDAYPIIEQNKVPSCGGPLSEKMVTDVPMVKSSLGMSSVEAFSVDNNGARSKVDTLCSVPTDSSEILNSLSKNGSNGLQTVVRKVVQQKLPVNMSLQDVPGSQSQQVRVKPQNHFSEDADHIITQNKLSSSGIALPVKMETEVLTGKSSLKMSSKKPSSGEVKGARPTVDTLRLVPSGSSETVNSLSKNGSTGLKTSVRKADRQKKVYKHPKQ